MTKPTIMIIEETFLRNTTTGNIFDRNKYTVILFSDAAAAIAYLEANPLPNMVLISTRLPDASALECARQIKFIADIPLIFLAHADDDESLFGSFHRYAEDFVIRPVEFGELDTRIQVALARMPAADQAKSLIIRIDQRLRIDFANNRAMIGRQSVRLTPTEAALLLVLVRHAPRVVHTHELLARVWPGEEAVEDVLRVHLHRLRRKIELEPHHPQYILTERGVGYSFAQRPLDLADDD